MKRVAVIGSRTFSNYKKLEEVLNKWIKHDDIIVSGGANGADKLAEIYAKNNGIETLIFPADWKKYGKSAGIIRNHDIINNCDIVIAFWDGVSKGTKNSMNLARKAGKDIIHIGV